jgi:hypothetical protein
MRVALGLSGCVALFALAAQLVDESKAAAFCVVTACEAFGLTYIACNAARKKAVDALRETDNLT